MNANNGEQRGSSRYERQLTDWFRNGGLDALRRALPAGPAEPVGANETLARLPNATWGRWTTAFHLGLAGDGFERAAVIGLPQALFVASLDELTWTQTCTAICRPTVW